MYTNCLSFALSLVTSVTKESLKTSSGANIAELLLYGVVETIGQTIRVQSNVKRKCQCKEENACKWGRFVATKIISRAIQYRTVFRHHLDDTKTKTNFMCFSGTAPQAELAFVSFSVLNRIHFF